MKIYSLKKKIKRTKKKKVIVFGAKNNFYKIVWGKSREHMRNEELALKAIDENSIWQKKACLSKSVINTKSNMAVYKSKKLVRTATIEGARGIVNALIQRFKKLDKLNKFEYKIWYKSLDIQAFNKFWKLIDNTTKQHINHVLGSSMLPITGAYGDLHNENVMVCEFGCKYLIDWEYFRVNGSFITDILRFESKLMGKNSNINKAQYHHEILKNYDPSLFINKFFKNDLRKISLLAAINNTCIPGVIAPVEIRTKHFLSHFHENS